MLMNNKQLHSLINKYEAGKTSLEEEEYLRSQHQTMDNEYQRWFQFMNNHKLVENDDIKKEISIALQKPKRNNRTIRIITTVAATLIIALILFFKQPANTPQSLEEKTVLLNEAIQMFNNTSQNQQKNIIYEDKLLVIYNK